MPHDNLNFDLLDPAVWLSSNIHTKSIYLAALSCLAFPDPLEAIARLRGPTAFNLAFPDALIFISGLKTFVDNPTTT